MHRALQDKRRDQGKSKEMKKDRFCLYSMKNYPSMRMIGEADFDSGLSKIFKNKIENVDDIVL